METERLRSAQLAAEKMLEAREKAHRQRIKGLEETVSQNFPNYYVSKSNVMN